MASDTNKKLELELEPELNLKAKGWASDIHRRTYIGIVSVTAASSC